jgi:LuxR family transcriptional regulator, maltose regulon positive regulatory protein
VAVEQPEARGAATELDESLLDAKLSIPQPHPGSVVRADLIDRARTSGCRVIGITTPAGYGKSTLLAQWAAVEERPLAWVSLDRFDDDPAALLFVLASAFARMSPGHARLVGDMSGLGISALGRAAPRLAAALRTSTAPFVLMIDDLHELRSAACHDVLGVVLSGLPAGSQVVVSSRSEQPHLPRLRASGDALELLVGDLAMDAQGAAQIFADAQVSITTEMAQSVTERTEGWPVGLRLAALIARDGGDVLTLSGEDRFVSDYLYRESLAQQPEDVQRFLRRTAVLDHLCAPLCDAMLAEPGSQQRLRDLESANVFLLPLDRRREWFRYHALFREFLLGELRRVEPDTAMKLHLRAADWYEANGSAAMALEHLLSTTERDRCVRLVTALILPTYQAGLMTTVQRWLAALGNPAIEAYPPLAVLATWVTALTGQTADAQRWAAVIDAASFDLVPLDGSASFESARAMVRSFMYPAGPENALADADVAMSAEPAWSPWRDQALCMCGEAHLLCGDVRGAADLFEESSALAASAQNADILVDSEAELALIAMDHGRWDEAAQRLALALAVIEDHRMSDYATSVLAFAGAARLAVYRGDREDADRQLARAMRARPSLTFVLPSLAVRARLQLAIVYRSIGNATAARHLLKEIDDILIRRPALGTLLDQVADLRRMLSTSPETQVVAGSSPLTPAELRLLPYLQTHLTIGEIGERLFISRNTVSTEVGSIYRKLGVSSRGMAVQQATAVGLLGG